MTVPQEKDGVRAKRLLDEVQLGKMKWREENMSQGMEQGDNSRQDEWICVETMNSVPAPLGRGTQGRLGEQKLDGPQHQRESCEEIEKQRILSTDDIDGVGSENSSRLEKSSRGTNKDRSTRLYDTGSRLAHGKD